MSAQRISGDILVESALFGASLLACACVAYMASCIASDQWVHRALAAPRVSMQRSALDELSGPLAALRRVTWRGGSGERLELSATRAEWQEGAQRVTLEGEVVLRRLTAGESPLTLRCERATLSFVDDKSPTLSGSGLELSSLSLTGGVRLVAPELELFAAQISWAAGGPLKILGGVKGRWRAHQLNARGAIFWPESGRLEVSEVHATIELGPRRAPVQRARER